MATKKFEQISQDIKNLKAAIQLLTAEIDKYTKEGKDVAEINDIIAKSLETASKDYTELIDKVSKYTNANAGNRKSNKGLNDDLIKLAGSVSSLKTTYGSLTSTLNGPLANAQREQGKRAKQLHDVEVTSAKDQTDIINELIRQQKNRLFQIEQEEEAAKRLRGEKVADLNSQFNGMKQQVAIDTAAANSRERLAEQTERASKRTKTFGDTFRQAFSPQAWGSAIANVLKFVGIYQLLYAAIDGVRELILGSAKAFIAYEDAIGKLNAITLATGEQSKILSESIRTVAVETRFTATEVAALATSLAKLGATSNEIPDLLQPIALAAQATGESLDSVGETILKVNNQFGLVAGESAVTAQTLVSAINESALSLNTFNTAIQYIGPVASQVGYTFAETAEYMKVLADNGFTASRIGTGLRSIFTDLKKPGEDLTKTLKELADANISVAEAKDLVGRRAAAQLLVILREIDAMDSSAIATDNLADSLKAASAQMSTSAGRVDILKSAFEEFKLKIGEAIVNTEFFFELIGLLSEDSEALARGYELLNEVFKKNENALSENVKAVYEGQSAYKEMMLTVKESVPGFNDTSMSISKLFQRVKNISEDITIDQVFDALFESIKDGSEGAVDYFKLVNTEGKITASQLEQIGDVFDGFRPNKSAWDFKDQVITLKGYKERIDDGVASLKRAEQAEKSRVDIQAQFKEEYDAVVALGVKNESAQKRALVLEDSILKKKSEVLDKLKEEESKGSAASRAKLQQYQAEISGLEEYANVLSEFNMDSEEADKLLLAARKKKLDEDKGEITRRKAELQERLRQIKKIRDEEIKSIEERRKLESGRAATSEERANIELKAAADIKKANEELGSELKMVADETRKLTDDTLELKQKYQDFPDAFDDFATQFEKLLFDISTAQESVITDPTEFANQLLTSLNNVMSGFEQSLAELKDYYGDTAQGQVDFADASVREFERLKESLDSLVGQYYSMKAGLEVAFGPQAAAVILGPLSAAIDTAEKRLNAMGMSVKENAENVAENVSEQYRQLYIDGLEDALKTAIDALNKFNDVAYQNTKDRIEREQDLVDARYSAEEDILKSQLDNQLITEAEYLNKKNQLRRKQIGEENTLEKALFDASQRRDKQNATADYLQALASIIPNLILYDKTADPVTLTAKSIITGALATAAYGSELAAIGQRKFIPKKFAEGGFVSGPSHDDGGVPFTVQGRGGYEMEGGEFIVNKRAAQLHKNVLERINNSTRPTVQNGKLMFETGGVIPINGITASTLQSSAGGAEATLAQLDYLRAIAETNVNISQNTSKPVRAYVTSADLSSNTAERKIKERNTLI